MQSSSGSSEKFSPARLADDFSAFGLEPGDVVYIRAAPRNVGAIEGSPADAILDSIRDVIGPEGTLVMPAFTRQYAIWQRNIPFADEEKLTTTGVLTRALLARADAVRSQHPTHSFVAVGGRAKELMAGHTHGCACFEPMRKLADADAKMMLVGCIDQSPGFSTVHLAQYDLGLSQQHYLRLAFHVKVRGPNGEPVYVKQPESPGCSLGFGKFYKDYEADGNMRLGSIGLAPSMLVGAQRALQTEKAILARNSVYALCDRETCIRCRVLCGYNLSAAPRAIWMNLTTRGPAAFRHILRGGSGSDLVRDRWP